MAGDPIGSAAKRSLRTADDVVEELQAWNSATQPFPYSTYRFGVQLVRDARVRSRQTLDANRQATLISNTIDLANFLSGFSEPVLEVMRNRWSGFVGGAQGSGSIGVGEWSSWWRELADFREVIDSRVMVESVALSASAAWVGAADTIEDSGRGKVA